MSEQSGPEFYFDPFEDMQDVPEDPVYRDFINRLGTGRELQFASGRTALSPRTGLVVGCRYSFLLQYESEAAGLIADTVVKFSIPKSWTQPQTTCEEREGFVKAVTDAGTALESEITQNGNMTWWINVRIPRQIAGDNLVRLYYRNVDIQRYPQNEFNNLRNSFRTILFDTVRKCYSVVPAGRTEKPEIIAAPMARWQIAGASSVRPGDLVELRISAVDYCDNSAFPPPTGIVYVMTPEAPFRPLAQLKLSEGDRGFGRLKLQVPEQQESFRVLVCDRKDRVTSRSPTMVVDEAASVWNVYFGDLHAKTRMTDGLGTAQEYFRHLRDVALCDFGAIADHNGGREASFIEGPFRRSLSDDEFEEMQSACDYFNDAGRFVTLQAFEQNQIEGYPGHRNCYFRGQAPGLFKGRTLEDLYRYLADYKALIIPHHHLIWKTKVHLDNPEFSKVIEMYSMHCSSEQRNTPLNNWPNWPSKAETGISAREILDRGYRVGFIAASDNHNGAPGLSARPSRFANLTYRGGLAAVHAPALTREDIFDGIYSRRCYATTGARIYLRFQVNGEEMGSELKTRSAAYRIVAAGTAALSSIELISSEGDTSVFSYTGTDFIDLSGTLEFLGEAMWIYVRVTQIDRHMAWSSPIWLDRADAG